MLSSDAEQESAEPHTTAHAAEHLANIKAKEAAYSAKIKKMLHIDKQDISMKEPTLVDADTVAEALDLADLNANEVACFAANEEDLAAAERQLGYVAAVERGIDCDFQIKSFPVRPCSQSGPPCRRPSEPPA